MYRLYFDVPSRKGYGSYPYVWYNTSTCRCAGAGILTIDIKLAYSWFNPSFYSDISYIEVPLPSDLPILYPELFI